MYKGLNLEIAKYALTYEINYINNITRSQNMFRIRQPFSHTADNQVGFNIFLSILIMNDLPIPKISYHFITHI